jgi:hypothetical protein
VFDVFGRRRTAMNTTKRTLAALMGTTLMLGSVIAHLPYSRNNALFAQEQETKLARPRISIRVGENGSSDGGGSIADTTRVTNLLLRERRATLRGTDAQAQSGNIRFVRDGSTALPLVVAYTLTYLDSAGRNLQTLGGTTLSLPVPLPLGAVATPPLPTPTPTDINSLRGDLAPTMTIGGRVIEVGVATNTTPNSFTLPAGQASQPIAFTARWSDQTISPRSAGTQGRRTVIIRLLPDAVGTTYDLGTTIATVTLDDPERVAPMIMNAIQDKQLVRGAADLVELETPGYRSDGAPNTVFYDDNYNVLTYTAISSDPTIVSVQVRQSDERFGGRPSLSYQAQPNAPIGSTAEIRVVANDGFGGLGTDIFRVTVVSSVTGGMTSINRVPSSDVSLSIAPNPVAERLTVHAQARQTGTVRVSLTTALGAVVASAEHTLAKDERYVQEFAMNALPVGVYFLEINDGSVRSVEKIVKH